MQLRDSRAAAKPQEENPEAGLPAEADERGPCVDNPSGGASTSACIYVSLYVSQKCNRCRLRENYGKVDDENAWPRGRNVPAL